VDDLDRADPKLVPQLLLSFREILDLPGFAFVLAFDDDIIGDALVEYHSAWSDGGAFLEKILDFRFDLPPLYTEQKVRLIERALRDYCSFVPPKSLKQIDDLLPGNPRRLKGLVRNMSALKTEVERHHPEELNWVDIWLAQLIRIESLPFFSYLLTGDVLEHETGMGFVARQISAARQKEDDSLAASLREHIRKAGIEDESLRSRLEGLIEAVRARGSSEFRYQAQIAWRPDVITGKEYQCFGERYDRMPEASTVNNWIAAHASSRGASYEVVAQGLFETMLKAREAELTIASDSRAESDHDSHIYLAGTILGRLQTFLLDANLVTPARFRLLFDQTAKWAGFFTMPTNEKARAAEKALLLRLVTETAMDVIDVLDTLTPWRGDYGMTGSGAKFEDLLAECVAAIRERCEERTLALFDSPSGIHRLLEHGKLMGYKYCLWGKNSGFWQSRPQREKLFSKIGEAASNQIVYDNSVSLFEMLFMNYNIDLLSNVERSSMMGDREFVAVIWRAVTSKRIQFRLRSEYRGAHRKLIAAGNDPAAIALPEELVLSDMGAGAAPEGADDEV
jgi:hypothetical protein